MPGVAGIDSIGGYAKQYLVVPDVQRLAAMNIGLTDLAEALEAQQHGRSAAASSIAMARAWPSAPTRWCAMPAELSRIVVATRGGVPVTLGQVATVQTGQAVRMGSASENGTEVVVGTAIMRIGENSRTVATGVADQARGDQRLAPRRRRSSNRCWIARLWSIRPSGRSPEISAKARCW